MKKTRTALFAGLLLAAIQTQAQVSITSGGTYTENFDILDVSGLAWADNTTIAGWYAGFTNIGSATFTTPTAYVETSGGGTTSTTFYSMRNTSSSLDHSPGGFPSAGGGQLMLGWRFVNGGAAAITNLVLTYDGEEWRRGNGESYIGVSYQIFSAGSGGLATMSGWIDAPSTLRFNPPVIGDAASLNGNLAENRVAGLTASITGISLQPGQEIWFRWHFVKVGGTGYLMGVDNAKLEVPIGTAPVIGPIENITVKATQKSATNSFTVNDAEDDAASIPLGTPVASSSNEAILPSANIFIEGTGSTRTVYVIGGATAGTVDVTVSLADSNGNVGRQTFSVTVRPADTAPFFGSIRWTNTLHDVPVTVPFTVGDEESAASELNVTGAVAAYSASILSSLQFGTDASGTNRTVAVTPVPGASGVGIVNLTVDDSVNTNASAFAVMVLPDGNTVFMDHFDYPVDQDILANSPGFWLRRNTSASSQKFETVVDSAQALIKPISSAEDAAAPLAFGPYLPGSGVILYTMLKAQWVDLGLVPENSTGPFVLLAPTSSASADQVMQVATATGDGGLGSFKLILSNGENIYTPRSTDLSVGPVYNIVSRYHVDTAKATLWVDATSESDPGISATDDQAPTGANFVCFRQEPGMGYIYIDDLKVVAIRKPTITSISAPSGGHVEILFTAGAGDVVGDFEVERADVITAAFQAISGTITSLGNGNFKAVVPASGDQGYYRVKRGLLVF